MIAEPADVPSSWPTRHRLRRHRNDGQPLNTGASGLIAAADENTHAALLKLIEQARRTD
jgi:hypothetical protein